MCSERFRHLFHEERAPHPREHILLLGLQILQNLHEGEHSLEDAVLNCEIPKEVGRKVEGENGE